MKRESAGLTIWRMIYPILIFLGVDTVLTLILMYGYIGYQVASGNYGMTSEDIMALTNNSMNFIYANALYLTIVRSIILIPIFFVMINRDVRRDKIFGRHVEYEPYRKTWLLLLPLIGFVACVGFNNFVMMLMEVLQDIINYVINALNLDFSWDVFASFNESSSVIYSGNIFVQLLATCVCAPLVEETLFRGLVYKRLRNIMKVTPCMIISSVIFGVVHGNMVQFVYASLVGLVCAYVYEKFKTIWAPIILHAGANFLSVMITMISNFATEGNTAGTENVDPSIGYYMLATVIYLAGTFLFLMLLEKKFHRKPVVVETTSEGNPN